MIRNSQIFARIDTFAVALIALSLASTANADRCPTSASKHILRSANGSWSDNEYILTQQQEWAFVDLDDLPIPIPLPKVEDTRVSALTYPTVSVASTPLPAGQQIAALFYKLQSNDGTCPVLLMVSTDWTEAIAVKFNKLDGAPQSASRVDLARTKSGAATLASENIDRSGNDELVVRSSNGLITAVLSIAAESQIGYNSLLTMESIWTDFLEKAADNNTIALKYLTSELESAYSAPANFQILTKIKTLQKDFDFIEINEESARLAVVLTRLGKDYLHYVSFEKKSTGWRIAGF